MTPPERTFAEHEALCRRCGQSCHFAVPVNGLPVVIDDLHCRYLARDDDGGFRCTEYERRFELAPWCATVERGLEAGLMAQDCPYAEGLSGYRGKTRLRRRLLDRAMPTIREHVLLAGVPIGCSEQGLLRFLDRSGPGRFRVVEAGDRLEVVARD